MSDTNQSNPPIQLPAEAIPTLKENLSKANALIEAWDNLEKAGVTIPGTKEQLIQARDLTKSLLENFAPKGS